MTAHTPDWKDPVPEVVAYKLEERVPFDINADGPWRSFHDSIKRSVKTFGKDDCRPCEADGRAAFGAMSVCGPDNRGVFQFITNQSPAKEVATAKLLIEYTNVPDEQKYWQASAAFVSPTKLVTAAHCMSLLPDFPDAQLVRIYVIPGAWKANNGGNVEPFGRQVASWAVRAREWTGRNWEHDWGFLVMPDRTLYDRMARKAFTMRALTNAELRANQFEAAGYPADLDPDGAFKQAHSIHESLTNVQTYVLKSRVDTFGGMSGGPLNMLSGSTTFLVVGIVSHGDAANQCRIDNGFTRLTQGRIDAIANWQPRE